MARRAPFAAAVAVLALAALRPGEAAAQEHSSVRFDVHGTVGWYRDLGVGFRADIPVLSEGIADGTDDDLRITLGFDALWFYHHDGFGFYPVAAFQWNFYLSSEWSIFPEVGAVLLFGTYEHYWRTFIAPSISFGARWHWNERNAFLMRINWPTGLHLGITF